jgi:hypothetical protein
MHDSHVDVLLFENPVPSGPAFANGGDTADRTAKRAISTIHREFQSPPLKL